jgi:hypothetical protein
LSQIFISHSAKDVRPLEFLNRAFATSGVEAKYEEIEAIISGRRTAAKIRADINASRAIFVVLGPNVEKLKHTRDWVVWESGIANGLGKDIWVIEAFEDSSSLSVVIPHLRHYVAFHYDDAWLVYLRKIVSSYDDSQPFKIVSTAAGLGALVGEGIGGALVGGGIGILLAAGAQPKAPSGLPFSCPTCTSVYSAHISESAMRCPVCNSGIEFRQTHSRERST